MTTCKNTGSASFNFGYQINEVRACDIVSFGNAVELAMDFYYGRQLQENLIMPSGMEDRDRQRLYNCMSSVNITKMIADKIGGGIYSRSPYRELLIDNVADDSEDESEPIESDAADRVRWNWQHDPVYQHMGDVNAVKCLIGTLLLVAKPDYSIGRARLMEFRPDQMRIIQNKDWPDRADGFACQYSAAQTVEMTTGKDDTLTLVYRPGSWAIYKNIVLNDADILNLPEPHGEKGVDFGTWKDESFMPVTIIRYGREIGAGSIYGAGLLHELIPANMTLNIMLTAHNVLTKEQGLATMWMNNVNRKDVEGWLKRLGGVLFTRTKTTGTESLSPTVQYISPDGDTEKLESAIKTFCEGIFARFGLRNHAPLELNMANPESGIAKWIGDAEIRETQYSQAPSMITAEREMAHNLSVINTEFFKAKPLPEGYTMRVDYMEPKMPVQPAEQIMKNEYDLNSGLKSKVQLIMERNEDIKTRDQALAYLAQVERDRIDLESAMAKIKKENAGEIADQQEGEPESFV